MKTEQALNVSGGYAIEHVARICSLSDWRNVQMVMLTTALDCSQDKSKQFFVMAGFVSSAERWAEFDGEWRNRLRQDGLEYFHMHKFAHSIKPFDKNWKNDERRRRSLLSDLLDIISCHAWHKVACILPVNSMRLFSDKSRATFVPSLVATAGRLVWSDIETWRKRERFQQPARMVFEDGDDDKGTLITALKEVTGRSPSFEPKKDDPAKGITAFTPIQAADILAYESQKLTQRYDQPVHGMTLRFPYHQMEKIPGDIQVLREDGAKIQEELLKVVRYFDCNPLGSTAVQ